MSLTVDAAENTAFSDIKKAMVTFVVDRTAPVVALTGLETDGRYQVEKQEVTLIPTDDGGLLNTLLVRTVDENGKELEQLVSLSGEEFRDTLDENDGKISFEINEGMNQNVQVICTDCSVDSQGYANTYDITFNNISVSSNAMKMIFSGKGIIYAIVTVGVVGVGTAGVFVYRRKFKLKIKK